MPIGTGYSLANGIGAAAPVPFTVLGVSPAIGDTQGGTLITITVTDSTGVASGAMQGRPLTSVAILDPTHVTAVTPAYSYPATLAKGRSIAYAGGYLWVTEFSGNTPPQVPSYIQKIDISMSSPSAVANIDMSAYGMNQENGSPFIAREIKSSGGYVFVCVAAINNSADVNVYEGYCVILDSSDQVVGHVALSLPSPSPMRAADCRSVTFDDVGNFFVVQSPSASYGSGNTYIHKFSVANVLAAYPAYGTPTWSVQLTEDFVEEIDFGGGYIWITGGPKQQYLGGNSTLTRIDSVTGGETIYYFNTGAYPTYAPWGVKYLGANKLLVSASPISGANVPAPILQFDPSTFPADPTSTIAVPGGNQAFYGNAFAQDSDLTSFWWGGYAAGPGTKVYKFDGTNTVTATVSLSYGSVSDLAFDGTNLWALGKGLSTWTWGFPVPLLERIDVTPGGEAVTYSLNNLGSETTGVTGVSLFNGAVTSNLAASYSYQPLVPMITNVSPPLGTSAGGDAITISVTDTTGVTDAQIGGVSIVGLTIVDGTTLTGLTPPNAVGFYDVTVTNAFGTTTAAFWAGLSGVTYPGKFEYY